MSVIIESVEKGSPAFKAGIKSGDTLLSINAQEIVDVLDYRFYQNERKLKIEFINKKGKLIKKTVRKSSEAELGLCFETYLMDKQHSCKNKCIFCFIDQLPKGLRKSLYFKDDDSRLSFLFGNYITLTNLTEHEIARIIKMHISPVNISVHTTDPELRVKMMKNKHAGEVLGIMDRFDAAGIKMNCQLVWCPGVNAGDALKKTLEDLTALKNVGCIAAVPVGITKYRDGLEPLTPYNKQTAEATLDILEFYGEKTLKENGFRRVFGSDEFYIMAERPIPNSAFYEDFLQLENGVGLWALLRDEAHRAIEDAPVDTPTRRISIATGVSAAKLMQEIIDLLCKKCHNLSGEVFAIKNNFFGEKITVSGLITGGDILEQLKDKDLGDALLIPSSVLRHENDLFLDDMHIDTLSKELGVPVIPVNNDGYELIETILDIKI